MSKFANEVTQLDRWEARKQLQHKALIFMGCDCSNQAARGRRTSNGGWHWTTQCLDCGLLHGDKNGYMQWVKKSHPLVLQAGAYIEIDDELRKETKKRAYFIASYLFKDELRKDREFVLAEWLDYKRYLASSDWQADRKKALERDRHLCQLNHFGGCTKKATTVHHLDYTRWRQRYLSDLVSCCRKCHEWEHPHLRGEDWL